jgi:hypothetical protein
MRHELRSLFDRVAVCRVGELLGVLADVHDGA